jgi:hypothetical protein
VAAWLPSQAPMIFSEAINFRAPKGTRVIRAAGRVQTAPLCLGEYCRMPRFGRSNEGHHWIQRNDSARLG